MTGKKKTSLRTAWYGVIFIVTLLPIIILVPVIGWKAYNMMLDSALDLQVKEIRKVRDGIEHEVENLFVLLYSKNDILARNLSRDLGRAAGSKAQVDYDSLYRSIDSLFSVTESLHSITLFARDGRALAHVDNPAYGEGEASGGAKDHDFSGQLSRPEFVVPMHGRNYFGTPHRQEKGVFFLISVPVGPKSDPLGVISANVEVGGVWREVQKKLEDRGALIYLIDGRGVLLNSSRKTAQSEGTLLTNLNIVRRLITQKDWNNSEEYVGLYGEKVFGTGVFLERVAWGIVSEIPVKQITGPIMKVLIPLLVFGVILFAVCAVFGVWLIGRMLKPVGELSSAFAGVSVGDYSRKVAPSSITEIDALASGFNSMVSAITQREEALRNSEEALKKSETKYRLIHEISFDGIIVADTESRIIECNRSAERIFGYEEGELEGKNLTELIPMEFRQRHLDGVRRFCETGKSQVQGHMIELQGLRKNGDTFPIELVISSFDLNGKMVFTGTIRDITVRKDSERSIKHMAYHDHLTGLPNRILFKDRLEQVLLREAWQKKTAAVLFLDLDRFKIINDTLGHAFGDKLLKVVAGRLQECLRDGDTVARLGGDEFTILLQDVAHIDDIPLVVEKILNTIKQPIVIDGQEVIISTSIGVSIFPDDGQDTGTLLKNADTAMYRAKSEGTNNFQLYEQVMSTKAEGVLKMEHRLGKAIENGDLTVHYQPEVDIRTGRLVGMEALVRLADRPDGTLTPPGDFITIAEETGMIIPLSEGVLRAACEQNKAWQAAGHPAITVAVNISPRVFKQKNFIQTVADTLRETGLRPEHLELEITEETMMGNIEETVRKMNAFRELGVRFVIDDFGTGYSSLSYIKMLPIAMLKIDRSFVRDLLTNSDDKAIVTAIIRMAHSMDVEVVAEGVETQEQAAYLKSIGCDKLQGYLLSRPVAHGRFEELFKEPASLNKYLKDAI
ncbi:MAG: EAL domain-containing protein [Thermodesulfobacteriota bacterium]